MKKPPEMIPRIKSLGIFEDQETLQSISYLVHKTHQRQSYEVDAETKERTLANYIDEAVAFRRMDKCL